MLYQQLKGILVLFFGLVFLILGIIGFILPIVPGWLFAAMGVLLLSLYFPRLRVWIDSHTVRWPRLHKLIHSMRVWADRNIGKI
jgi:uncharacterized membrane protein YbaN (DUF454 family)